MIWLAWRRQRTETLIAAAFVALLAAWLVPVGLRMGSVYDRDGLAACVGHRTFSCNQLVNDFTSRFDKRGIVNAWFNLLPGLIGVLLAAPLLLELERGTYRLVWTQSIARGRFVTVKIGFAVASAILAAVLLTALLTWWRAPLDRLQGRIEPGVFDVEGTVMVGYVLFATALALAVGVVWRRAVPALVVGFAGYAALRIFTTDWLRQRLLSPIALTWNGAKDGGASVPVNAWVISEYPSDRAGHRIALAGRCLRGDPNCVFKPPTWVHTVYQPASRFWELQAIETALFGGLAVGFILFAAWWVRERVA